MGRETSWSIPEKKPQSLAPLTGMIYYASLILPPPPPSSREPCQVTIPSKTVRLAEPSLRTGNTPAYSPRWKPCSHHGGSAFVYGVRYMDPGYHKGGHTLAIHLSKARLTATLAKWRFASSIEGSWGRKVRLHCFSAEDLGLGVGVQPAWWH